MAKRIALLLALLPVMPGSLLAQRPAHPAAKPG